MKLKYEPLNAEQVQEAIVGQSYSRPPAHQHIWPGEGLREYHGEQAVDEVFAPYPRDVMVGHIEQPGYWEAPEGFPSQYRWAWSERLVEDEASQGKDSGGGIIKDWGQLDKFLDTFPSVDNPKIYDKLRAHVRKLIDTFYHPGVGRCVVAAGNGITGATPLENIDAFLDEIFRYGLELEKTYSGWRF